MNQLNLFKYNEEHEVINKDCKKCRICEKTKLISDFPKHIANKDNLDTRCRDCIKKETALRKKIKETAPPHPEDGRCECCGKEINTLYKKSWYMDHCHKTKKFRGWLCNQCNFSIGGLGDDVEGVIKALNYLYRTKYNGQDTSCNMDTVGFVDD
tara:strand:+ start:1859 stop:2320 length:462 start_codon:yes stop_codon:yes gene_type:complete